MTDFRDRGVRERAVVRALRPLDPGVARAIEAFNARLAPSPARDAHLAALREGAAAVVTGQQVGFLLGPLYTLYKALSAVKVARALAEESGRAVVPVFWLQSEDHDLVEIATAHVPAPGGTLSLPLPASADNRISIAHLTLPSEVGPALAQLQAALQGLPHAEEHLSRVARWYRAGAPWVEAFAGLLAELTAAEGLVFIDPRDPALAAHALPVHARAIERAKPIADALCARAAELGAEAPVHVKPGASLSFFHPEGPLGPRRRLEPGEAPPLDGDPRRFSTSALLRPILQDTLLPTAAYVGGPTEVAYFAQLPPLYAEYGLEMPLILPRARFRMIDARTRRLLERLGLAADDAAEPLDALLARVAPPVEPSPAALRAGLLDPFDAALSAFAPALGPPLDASLEKTRATVHMAVAKLAERWEKTALHRHETIVAEVRRLQDALHPHGEPEERVHCLCGAAAKHGERALIDLVLGEIEPFAGTRKDLLP